MGFSGAVLGQKDSIKSRNRPTASVSLNAGAGIPTNGFNINAPGTYGGLGSYAEIGYTVNLFGGFPIAYSHFGVAGLISYNAEPFDINQCLMNLCSRGNTDEIVSYNSSDFKETLLMSGLYFSTTGKLKLSFRILAGFNFCTLAGYSLKGTTTFIGYRTGPAIYDVTSSLQLANSSSVVYDIGIGVNTFTAKHFFGVLNCDFIYSQAYFNTTYYNNTSYNNTGTFYYWWLQGSDHFLVNYQLLNFTVGFGYKL